MNIQFSVIVWTVICFLLLLLILNKLLFTPLLSFMDERKAKIESAKQRKAEKEAALKAAREQQSIKRAEQWEEAKQQAALALEEAHRQSEERFASEQAARKASLEKQQQALMDEEYPFLQEVAPKIHDLAAAFVERFVSRKEKP